MVETFTKEDSESQVLPYRLAFNLVMQLSSVEDPYVEDIAKTVLNFHANKNQEFNNLPFTKVFSPSSSQYSDDNNDSLDVIWVTADLANHPV